MTSLDELLGDEFKTPEARLYFSLAEEDQHLLARLIEARKERGLSQEDVADRMGLTQATISAFERLGNDPKLSTVRRYAKTVGVMVRHFVETEPAQVPACSEWLTHQSDEGASTQKTAEAVARLIKLQRFDGWPNDDRHASPEAIVEQSADLVAGKR